MSVMSPRWRRCAVLRYLFARDGAKCAICDLSLGDDVTLDHIVPRLHGGITHSSNLRLAHKACNEKRGDSGCPRCHGMAHDAETCLAVHMHYRMAPQARAAAAA